MALPDSLVEIMAAPLPSITEQKRLVYRPSLREVQQIYKLLNRSIFKNKLVMPEIQLGIRRQCWGLCVGYTRLRSTGSYCVIKLSDKWYCRQWLVTVLAHEMSHQYQWDVIGPKRKKQGKEFIMSHGPSFFLHRKSMIKHCIPLKTYHRRNRWFKYQSMHYC